MGESGFFSGLEKQMEGFKVETSDAAFLADLRSKLREKGPEAFPCKLSDEVNVMDPTSGKLEKGFFIGLVPNPGNPGDFKVRLFKDSLKGKGPTDTIITAGWTVSLEDFFHWNRPAGEVPEAVEAEKGS